VRVLEKNEAGWCFWPYKKMERTSAVVSFAQPAHWAEIVAYANMPGTSGDAEKRVAARPALEHSREAFQDLLQKIRFAN
jgi:endoglucanase